MESPLSHELAELALRVVEILKLEIRDQAAHGAPTPAQFRLLFLIHKGTRQVARLAEFLGVSQPAVSSMVEALASEGLLERTSHPSDRRRVELRLTKRGRASLKRVYGAACARVDARLASFSPSRRSNLARELRGVAALLSAERPSATAGSPGAATAEI